MAAVILISVGTYAVAGATASQARPAEIDLALASVSFPDVSGAVAETVSAIDEGIAAREAAQQAQEEADAAEAAEAAEAAPAAGGIDDPNSITVVVNKQRPLAPIDWAPADLRMPQGIPNTNGQPVRDAAASALERMYAAASEQGMPFTITSAYRAYDYQVSLFDNYAARDGVAAAETYSARPGHSEHQTGLAVDLDDGAGCAFMSCFGETATGQWLKANAHSYGFILRYNQGAEPTVGFIYEPWHFRYVGTEVAEDMHARGIQNLEDYYELPAAPTY